MHLLLMTYMETTPTQFYSNQVVLMLKGNLSISSEKDKLVHGLKINNATSVFDNNRVFFLGHVILLWGRGVLTVSQGAGARICPTCIVKVWLQPPRFKHIFHF